VFFYSQDLGGEHPERHADCAGLMQADAMPGSVGLRRQSQARPDHRSRRWTHGRRKFFALARLTKAPIAAEAVKRIRCPVPSSVRSTVLLRRSGCVCARSVAAALIVQLQARLREQGKALCPNCPMESE
jgi:transposase